MELFTENGPLPEGWGLWIDFVGIGGAKVVTCTITSEIDGRLIVSEIQRSITPSSLTPVNWFIPLGGHTIKSILLKPVSTTITLGMLYSRVYISNGFLASSIKLRLLCQGAVLPHSPLQFPFDNKQNNLDITSVKYLIAGNSTPGSNFTENWNGAGFIKPYFGLATLGTSAAVGDRFPFVEVWNESGKVCWEFYWGNAITASQTWTVYFTHRASVGAPTGTTCFLEFPLTPIAPGGSVVIGLYDIKAGDQYSNINLFCDWEPC